MRTAVIFTGESAVSVAFTGVPNVLFAEGPRREALTRALKDVQRLGAEAVAVLDANDTLDEADALLGPIERDEADVVLGQRSTMSVAEKSLARLAWYSLGVEVRDVACGRFALRVSALERLTFEEEGTDASFEVELFMKLARELHRFTHAPVRSRAPLSWPRFKALAQAWVRGTSDSNTHEAHATLQHLEAQAPNFNAWLGARFREHAGARVLEVGAGLGTITTQLAPGRDKVVALEVEEAYVRRLRNRFRGQKNVEVWQSDIALADWQHLAALDFDTVVLSNVLEHIPDDVAATRTFFNIVRPGGALLLLVPALPMLFGSLDEAVGHHRRYTPTTLRATLESAGFTVERLEWMNLVGIPGWLLNSKLLRRRVLPPLQLRLYDTLAPWFAKVEAKVPLPVGLSLFCVARRGS